MYNPRFARRKVKPAEDSDNESSGSQKSEKQSEGVTDTGLPLMVSSASRNDKIEDFVQEAGRGETSRRLGELREKESLWEKERAEYVEQIDQLNKDLCGLREFCQRGWPVERGRWAEFESFMTEVKILRAENLKLRTLSSDELQLREKDLIDKLRMQVSSLQTENAKLFKQLSNMRDSHLVLSRPPTDIPDLTRMHRIPLDLSLVDKERVNAALEEEWRRAAAESRHGKAPPLKSPFERRLYM